MTEQIQDAFNSIKDRFKNSFIVTFLIVWCVLHWEMLYTLVNFDDTEDRDSKVYYIKTYIEDHSMILEPLGKSLISLIALYVLFIISDLIHSAYNWVRGGVLSVVKSKKVIRIEEYNRLGKEIDRVRERASDYRQRETNSIIANKELEDKVNTLAMQIDTKDIQLQKHSDELKRLEEVNDVQKGALKILEENIRTLKAQVNSKDSEVQLTDKENKKLELKVQELNSKIDLLESFQGWVEINEPKVTDKWDSLSQDQIASIVNETFVKLRFKKIFGNKKWVKTITDSTGASLSEETLKLENTINPKFRKDFFTVYDVSDILFTSKNQISFVLHSNLENDNRHISLNIQDPNNFVGKENDMSVSFHD